MIFRKKEYKVVFTEHARLRMELRGISEPTVVDVLETGKIKAKEKTDRFWVYKKIRGRKDNLISVSICIEDPHLIVITTMVNWSPV